jgi:mRNA interferase YafQ
LRSPAYSGQFRRDTKRMQKRGKDMSKLRAVVQLILSGEPLPERLRDHALTGDWSKHRDCHIEPDWLLVYRIAGEEVRFERTGTHSDLFR